MARTFKDFLLGFREEVLARLREDNYARLDQVAFEERVIGIEKVVLVLCEIFHAPGAQTIHYNL